MFILLLAIDLFSFILLLYSIYAAIYVEKTIQFTIDKTLRQMKFYAFEAKITPTPRSITIMRNGHLLVAVVLVIFLVIINYFLFWRS